MTLGEKIHEFRKQNKYSQEKIAELVGVSRQAVTKWEADQSAPSTENLIKLANIYGISLDEFIHDNTEIPNITQKPTSKKWGKKIAILWCIGIVILIIIYVFTMNTAPLGINSLIWTLINLMLLGGYTSVGIYTVVLLIKALNKYIHTQ